MKKPKKQEIAILSTTNTGQRRAQQPGRIDFLVVGGTIRTANRLNPFCIVNAISK